MKMEKCRKTIAKVNKKVYYYTKEVYCYVKGGHRVDTFSC